jgi:riboflavin transporter FmnP
MKTRTLVTAALLTAAGVALNYVPFISGIPLIPGAPFLHYAPSDIPTLLGSFALGPIAGGLIGVFRAILHFIIGNTDPIFPIGTIMDALTSASFAVIAGTIYLKMKTRKGAVIGLVCGALGMTAIACVINYFWTYPAYAALTGLPITPQLVWTTALPFNLVKCAINGVVVFFLYKPLSVVLHGRRDDAISP